MTTPGAWQPAFRFDPQAHPVAGSKRYTGKFRFADHFYPVIADLEDGSEEWYGALAIDEHPQIVRRMRNLDSDPVNGFWLPRHAAAETPLSNPLMLLPPRGGDNRPQSTERGAWRRSG